jgi:tetratricopeptide (TPR) repeat protein
MMILRPVQKYMAMLVCAAAWLLCARGAVAQDDCLALFDKALDAYGRVALQESFNAFEQARACWLELSGGADTEDTALCLNYTGLILAQDGQYAAAMERYTAAGKIIDAVYGSNSGQAATIINNMGEAQRNMGDYTQALHSYEENRDRNWTGSTFGID